jgi:hypothetical protein
MPNSFRYYNSSPEIIRTAVLLYVKYPLSLRNVEDLLAERGIDDCHETVRQWWNRFGPMFAAEIRKRRIRAWRGIVEWRWHLDEVFACSFPDTVLFIPCYDEKNSLLVLSNKSIPALCKPRGTWGRAD